MFPSDPHLTVTGALVLCLKINGTRAVRQKLQARYKCLSVHAEKHILTHRLLWVVVLCNKCTVETVASCFLGLFVIFYKIKVSGLLLFLVWCHPECYLIFYLGRC